MVLPIRQLPSLLGPIVSFVLFFRLPSVLARIDSLRDRWSTAITPAHSPGAAKSSMFFKICLFLFFSLAMTWPLAEAQKAEVIDVFFFFDLIVPKKSSDDDGSPSLVGMDGVTQACLRLISG